MIGFFRLLGFALVVLTVFYVLIGLYARSVRREALEKQWDRGNGTGSRDEFIRHGMDRYRGILRWKLLIGVYVVPIVGLAVLIYVLNFT